jgi:hypothetical protein
MVVQIDKAMKEVRVTDAREAFAVGRTAEILGLDKEIAEAFQWQAEGQMGRAQPAMYGLVSIASGRQWLRCRTVSPPARAKSPQTPENKTARSIYGRALLDFLAKSSGVLLKLKNTIDS